jgi:hypothetical protein
LIRSLNHLRRGDPFRFSARQPQRDNANFGHSAGRTANFNFRDPGDYLRNSYDHEKMIRTGIAFIKNIRTADVGYRWKCNPQNLQQEQSSPRKPIRRASRA